MHTEIKTIGDKNMASLVIRIGEGRSKSGKILDHNTHWYNGTDKEIISAMADAKASGKSIYISRNGRAYKEITLKELSNIK